MPFHLAAFRILLSQIDLEDDTFSLLPWPEIEVPDALARSIVRVGILHPPLLKAAAAGYRVIAGRRRLQAVQDELKASGCTCLVLPEQAPDLEGLVLNLEDTLAGRPLSPIERTLFLQKVGRYLDEERIAVRYFPLLGLTLQTDSRKQIRLLELEEPLLKAVHAGSLKEETARELGELPFIDRHALFEIIQLVGIGGGEQRQLIEACREEARRKNRSILDLLACPAIKEILESPGNDPAIKTAALLSWLASP
ncbi:MAG: ParB N-terminal domain-containing protein [Deltaproteobacteria bacterium]|jgi:hypothetical protein